MRQCLYGFPQRRVRLTRARETRARGDYVANAPILTHSVPLVNGRTYVRDDLVLYGKRSPGGPFLHYNTPVLRK